MIKQSLIRGFKIIRYLTYRSFNIRNNSYQSNIFLPNIKIKVIISKMKFLIIEKLK